MDDYSGSTTSFADELDEFDRLLEDEQDEQPKRKGRASGAKRTSGASGDGDSPKRPTRVRMTPDWNRIAAVLFVAAIALFVVYFAATSIMHARRVGAYKDYFKDVRTIATQSAAQGNELESILDDPNGGDRAQRLARIEQLSTRADKLVTQAEAIEAPDELAKAQLWFVAAMQFRAAGLDSAQRSLTAALDSKDQAKAAESVASAMGRLLASDYIYSDSFVAESKSVLQADEVQEVTVPESRMVTDLEIVSPDNIAKMLVRLRTAGSKTNTGTIKVPKDGKIRGGQLEGGRVTVTPSGQTLALSGVNEIKGGDNVAFEVPFTNQGEVQLTDVPVRIVLRSKEGDPIELAGVIENVDPGETATATVDLDEVPTFGEILEMDILVGPIPGEKTTENNRASYEVQFSVS